MCDDEPAMDRQTERNGVWRKYISTFFTDHFVIAMLVITRHRASTSMYSLTFCVRVMLPERHLQWKPAVQAAAVMVRTAPSTASHRRASHAHFPYTARNFENAPVTRQSAASSARRPSPAGRSHYMYIVILRDGRKLIAGVRVMLP